MELTLFIENKCSACSRAEKNIREVIAEKKNITFTVRNLSENKTHRVFIVPALFIDEKLYFYGDVDKEKLSNKIDTLQQT